ncbi:MAG: hypothetical protein F4213_17670 [Boseongicola sp. SB0677_bin_26]|nr:hypothetical protein [Boseongicola sp. SB0665_bin_10]MYG27822.1 hypothetical protein [Boseongicola sp. SB0677_bin_26]
MKESYRRPGRIRKFNPGMLQSDEEVKDQFVVRNRELGVVLDVLQGNIDSPSCQHILLVAPRGRGKTMLLARVAAELRTGQALSERLLPVRFMEESQEVFSLADFWLEALFHLAREHAAQDPQFSRDLQATHAALAAEWHGSELEERARAAVLETIDRLGKQLVLMVENLQALCEHVDEDFGWKLRKVLQSEPEIMLLATATSRFKGLDDAREPFFELFRILRLEPLDAGECRRLWRMVSGDTVSDREIRPLQILTGGDPRLLVIIGDFARHRSLRQLMEEMVALIDEHTEYFRGHLEAFAKTERRVYLAVIDLWQPSSTAEIAARARMGVRAVSALLGRLVERGAVLAEGSGRKRKYAATERLYSIYYKLRRERDEAAIVRNLIHFMAVYYAQSELDAWYRTIAVEATQWPAIRDGLALAVGESPKISRIFPDGTRQGLEQISERTAAIVNAHARGVLDEISAALGKDEFERVIEIADRFLSAGRSGLAQVPDLLVASIVSAKAFAYEGLNDPEAELAIYDEVIERFGSGDAPELRGHLAIVLLRKGITLEQMGEDRAAIVTFDEIAERLEGDSKTDLQEWIVKAQVNKGGALERLGDNEAAIAVYDQVVDRPGNSKTPQIEIEVARALVRKGIAQDGLGLSKAAVATFGEVTRRFGNGGATELDEWVAMALVTKGLVLERLGESAAATAAYDEAVARFSDSESPRIKVHVARALVKTGFWQGQLGESRAAIGTFDRAVKRFGHSDKPELQVQVAIALVNKGAELGKLGEIRTAIAAFDEVVERFGESDAPEIQEGIARALSTKGFALEQLGEGHAAIAIYDQAIERFGDSEMHEVQLQVATVLMNKGRRQLRLGETADALATFDEMVERFGDSNDLGLQGKVADALKERGVTNVQSGKVQEAIHDWQEVVRRFGKVRTSELQARVVESMTYKIEMQVQLGRVEQSLHECDDLDRRIGNVSHEDMPMLGWRAKWLRTKVLVVLQRYRDAMIEFDSVYAVFDPGVETMMQEMIGRVLDLVANGMSESDLVEALSREKEKSEALLPLVVALRQRAGETVRAPVEALEVAADIRKFIEARASSVEAASLGTSAP